MKRNLIIVESPTKAKTISKILGEKYIVKSSNGHIRDLPDTRLGVEIGNDFSPFYLVDRKKMGLIADLKKSIEDATTVYLAMDHDREGEAIAWHLVQVLNLNNITHYRIHFHEITKESVIKAFDNVQSIDMQVVYAQQARRILDRLVGYQISPLLQRNVRRGLAAGRVQSVAVRIIVEREREIIEFSPREYWTIEAELRKLTKSNKDQTPFTARLIWHSDRREILLNSQQAAEEVTSDLMRAEYVVNKADVKQVLRYPAPPFITSSLQREAWSKLHFPVKKTMVIAQQLYEGLDVGEEEPSGLITYMRTDATRTASSAVTETREFIQKKYGVEYLPPKARTFPGKVRGAQEGHEAIRPTSILREPLQIKSCLNDAQFKLYDLIWKRMVASQMESASYDRTTIEIEANCPDSKPNYSLRASRSIIKFPGFMSLYTESNEEVDEEKDDQYPLPLLNKGDAACLMRLIPEQHYTQPPPRFSEAALVKTLEQYGIGRPSTYASIVTTIQNRGYVDRIGGSFKPTKAGIVVNDLLCEYFPTIVDIGFTVRMEENLDKIANDDRDWVAVLQDFYTPFKENLTYAENNMPKVRLPERSIDELCPECLSKYVISRNLVIKRGPTGPFLGCPGFNDGEKPCTFRKPYAIKTGVKCPRSNCSGELLEKLNRRENIFYSCSNYPDCDFKTNNRPISEPCTKCGGLLVIYGENKAKCINCSNKLELESE